MYKRILFSFAIVSIVAIAFLINGCQDSPNNPSTENPVTDAGNNCNTPNQFCGSPGTVFVQNSCPGDVQTIDLWVGVGNINAGALVGHVELYPVNATTWRVKYVFDGSFVGEIHFAIADQFSQIPKTNNGNPKPGHFPYKFSGISGSSYEFNITLPADPGNNGFFVAAHAGGTFNELSGVACFNASIPQGCVTVSSLQHGLAENCYWEFDLINAGTFNGHHCGWCMDLGTAILDSNYNCAQMFSSLTPFPEYLKPSIEGWQDMDKINWLMNNFEVGQSIQRMNYLCQPVGGTGVINVFDYQKAIWRILDLGPGSSYSELSDSLVVNALVCAMNANGEGFVPSCENGDVVVFFVDPGMNANNTRAQPFLAAAPCCTGGSATGTAWGDGKYGGQFPGPNWATYFIWKPACP